MSIVPSHNRTPLLIALTIAALPVAAAAQERSDPLAGVTRCRAEADPARRVACYDAAVDALTAARDKKDIVVLDREAVRETRRGLFGFTLPRIGLFGGKDDDPGVQEEREVATTVRSARSLGYGKWRIVVEDGAVWETTEATGSFPDPRPGAAITLQKGAMGGYFIKGAKGRRVAAKRIG